MCANNCQCCYVVVRDKKSRQNGKNHGRDLWRSRNSRQNHGINRQNMGPKPFRTEKNKQRKKRQERRKHWLYIKAESNNFAPPQTPSGDAGRPKFNQLETATTFTYKPRPSLVKIEARNFEFYRGNRPTHKQTHTNPQSGSITMHCAAAS